MPPYQILVLSSGVLWALLHGYTLFVMPQYEVIFTFTNQRFGKICLCNMHAILHALSLLVVIHKGGSSGADWDDRTP